MFASHPGQAQAKCQTNKFLLQAYDSREFFELDARTLGCRQAWLNGQVHSTGSPRSGESTCQATLFSKPELDQVVSAGAHLGLIAQLEKQARI